MIPKYSKPERRRPQLLWLEELIDTTLLLAGQTLRTILSAVVRLITGKP